MPTPADAPPALPVTTPRGRHRKGDSHQRSDRRAMEMQADRSSVRSTVDRTFSLRLLSINTLALARALGQTSMSSHQNSETGCVCAVTKLAHLCSSGLRTCTTTGLSTTSFSIVDISSSLDSMLSGTLGTGSSLRQHVGLLPRRPALSLRYRMNFSVKAAAAIDLPKKYSQVCFVKRLLQLV